MAKDKVIARLDVINVTKSVLDGSAKIDYDEKLDTGFSENKRNRYYILLEENGVEKPGCKMDLQFLENP